MPSTAGTKTAPSDTARESGEKGNRHPFEKSYPATVAVAVLALSPFIVALTAFYFFLDRIVASLATTTTAASIIISLATAGYAFGALLGGDLVQRFPQRQLFFFCEGLFVAGSVVAAVAAGAVAFGLGSVVMGFATGLLLVVALPPVIQRFPPGRLPTTALLINIAFFGAVTLGPLVGGLLAFGADWRVIYGAAAGVGGLNLGLAYLTLPTAEALNPSVRFDRSAITLGFLGTFLTFWAAGEALGPGFASPLFIAPLAVGGICLIALLVSEYFKENPLSPVRPVSSTIPVTGITIAMTGGGALFAFLILTLEFLTGVRGYSPYTAGLLFWPQIVAVLVAAGLLALTLRTRYIAALPFGGMLVLVAAGSLMLTWTPDTGRGMILLTNGLLGLGAGATVAPGLFITGFSVPSKTIGRTFALVELIRSEADFILAPVILQLALLVSGGGALSLHGFRVATWVAVALAGASVLLALGVYLAGGARLSKPQLESWLEGEETALRSPPLLAALRGDRRGSRPPS